jgi:uncharacterized protein (TIRG00374 family)
LRIGWRGAIGIGLSITLLWWALHDVSLRDVWNVLRASNLPLFVTSALVATVPFAMRAWRWRYILHAVAPNLPFSSLWRATAIGMMANNVAPLRAGEVARAYVISREEPRVRFTAALASLAVDRLFDAMAILIFLVAAMAVPSFPRGTLVLGKPAEQWAMVGGTIAFGGLAALMLLALMPRRLLALWDMIAGRVAPRFAARGRGILEAFASGLGVLRDPGRFLLVFGWTASQWLVNGLSFWIAFKAVGIEAPMSAAIFLQSLLALAVAIPSAPGFFGFFETVARGALAVYAIDSSVAVSYAIGYHVLSFTPITLIGLWYLSRMGLHFRDFGTPAPRAT